MWLQAQTCLFHHSNVLPWGGFWGNSEIGFMGQQGTWVSVRGASNRFFTHLDCTVVVVVVGVTAEARDVVGSEGYHI